MRGAPQAGSSLVEFGRLDMTLTSPPRDHEYWKEHHWWGRIAGLSLTTLPDCGAHEGSDTERVRTSELNEQDRLKWFPPTITRGNWSRRGGETVTCASLPVFVDAGLWASKELQVSSRTLRPSFSGDFG